MWRAVQLTGQDLEPAGLDSALTHWPSFSHTETEINQRSHSLELLCVHSYKALKTVPAEVLDTCERVSPFSSSSPYHWTSGGGSPPWVGSLGSGSS